MFRLSRVLVAVVLIESGAACQQTWKVNCSGALGAHFTDIPAAVAAASPGDTILVYTVTGSACPGGYYTAPTVDKPLRIVGLNVGGQPGNNTPARIGVDGVLQVVGCPIGQQVVIANMAMAHVSATSPSLISVTDCDGSVVLENIYFGNYGLPGQLIEVMRSDHVVIRGSTFVIAGDPIRITDSNVLLTNCLVYDTAPFPWFGLGYTMTTESLRLVRSTVTLSGSIVFGASNWGGALVERSAATLDNSTLRIGASCTFRGGRIPNTTGTSPLNYMYGYQFTTPAPSLVQVDPRVPPFSFLQGPVVTPIHETFHDWVVADEWYNVRVLGPQGGFALLTIGNMAFPGPSPWGELGIDLATVCPIDLVALPQPDGFYQWNFFCPSLVPVDFAFAFQTATIAPSGAIGLTTTSPVVPAWDKTRVP